MKSVLVTGSTGFIGKHCLTPLLDKNIQIHAVYSKDQLLLEHKNIAWHKVDLLDHHAVEKLLQNIAPSHLLHLAWYAKPQEYWTSPINLTWLQSSIHLLNCFGKAGGKRAVFVGTCAEYDWKNGYCQEYVTPCLPQTLYGRAKYSLHLLSEVIAKQENISLAWARPFFLFGEHEYAQRLIPSAICSFVKKQRFNVLNGDQIRDFMCVSDVADALVALLFSEVTGAVNIASGSPVSIRELVTQISYKLQALDYVNFQSNTILNSSNDSSVTADVNRLATEVKWRPQYSLDAALDSTIAWWAGQT